MFGSFRSDHHTDEASGIGGDSGLKDSRTKAVVIGLIAPALLMGLVACNVVLRRVYWPADHHHSFELVQTFDEFWIIAGTIMLKMGAAGVLFAWYWMANVASLERFCLPLGFGAVIVAAAGVILASIGFFL